MVLIWDRKAVMRGHNEKIGSGSQFQIWLDGVTLHSDVRVRVLVRVCVQYVPCPCSFSLYVNFIFMLILIFMFIFMFMHFRKIIITPLHALIKKPQNGLSDYANLH